MCNNKTRGPNGEAKYIPEKSPTVIRAGLDNLLDQLMIYCDNCQETLYVIEEDEYDNIIYNDGTHYITKLPEKCTNDECQVSFDKLQKTIERVIWNEDYYDTPCLIKFTIELELIDRQVYIYWIAPL